MFIIWKKESTEPEGSDCIKLTAINRTISTSSNLKSGAHETCENHYNAIKVLLILTFRIFSFGLLFFQYLKTHLIDKKTDTFQLGLNIFHLINRDILKMECTFQNKQEYFNVMERVLL